MAYTKFTLTIEMGNDAMSTRWDVQDVLSRVVIKQLDGSHDDGHIMDANGNHVGDWELEHNDA